MYCKRTYQLLNLTKVMTTIFHCDDAPEFFFFFSSRRRHTRFKCDWSSDVCSSDLAGATDLVVRCDCHVGSDGQAQEHGLFLAVLGHEADAVTHGVARPGERHRPAEIGRASCRERV